jgi:hypothetical protein
MDHSPQEVFTDRKARTINYATDSAHGDILRKQLSAWWRIGMGYGRLEGRLLQRTDMNAKQGRIGAQISVRGGLA